MLPMLAFGQTSPTVQVKTITNLVQLTIPAVNTRMTALVTGRVTDNDGGGGLFFYDSASVLATNLGTVFKPAASNGRWIRQYSAPVNVKWFGAVGDGVNNDTTGVQGALSMNMPTYFPAGTYLCGALTLTNNGAYLYGDDPTVSVIHFGTLGASTKGLTASVNDLMIEKLGFRGPAAATYVANEDLIYAAGASTSNRLERITIRNCEFKNVGSRGILIYFANKINISENYFHDIGYAAAMFSSCNQGNFDKNIVADITPGTSGNMYGVSITHDSSLWPYDRTTSPYSQTWNVTGNIVTNVAWEGIDFHGAIDANIIGNQVYETKNGIAAGSGSGGSAQYGGLNVNIIGNVISTLSLYTNLGPGITVNGGTSNTTRNVTISYNHIVGKGLTNFLTTGAISALRCTSLNIIGNTIENWAGVGMNIVGPGSSDIKLIGNSIKQLAFPTDPDAYAIYNTGTETNNTVILSGNMVMANGGTAARIGYGFPLATTRPYASGNNFLAATSSQFSGPSNNYLQGDNQKGIITATDGDTTPSVYGFIPGLTGLLISANTAPTTVTQFDDAIQGQEIIVINTTANDLTITRANAYLMGGTNAVIRQHDAIRLIKYGSLWYELSRSENN